MRPDLVVIAVSVGNKAALVAPLAGHQLGSVPEETGAVSTFFKKKKRKKSGRATGIAYRLQSWFSMGSSLSRLLGLCRPLLPSPSLLLLLLLLPPFWLLFLRRSPPSHLRPPHRRIIISVANLLLLLRLSAPPRLGLAQGRPTTEPSIFLPCSFFFFSPPSPRRVPSCPKQQQQQKSRSR